MADDDKTVALPHSMMRGGMLTDQIGDLARGLYDDFAMRTTIDPNSTDTSKNPFGLDAAGKKALATYLPAHTDLLKAVKDLADALQSAAAMTIGSGANFQKAQNDAIDQI
ncbi:hypothetical protein ACFY8K_35870 [Streptomyces misionensis]|uniref:hypothetical protein n=1 Tax=Streptomyces misionensis TaxID=67331 RepID=UPI0036BD936F